jgi:prepilin-type processing-associated H-X9-DG protein
MANQIQCPNCGQTYDLTPEQLPQYAGQTITCTQCQKPFTVPANIAGPTASPSHPSHMSDRPGIPPAYPQPQSQTRYIAPEAQQSNGLAIASLICGIIGFCFPIIPGLVGVILGILGLQKTRDPRVKGRGLAIAGISVSAVALVISLIGSIMFLSVLLPSIKMGRETANRVKCASNMRQIGQAILLYANENKGHYPPDLLIILKTQDITTPVFVCPSAPETAGPPVTPQTTSLPQGSVSYIYVGQNLTSGASRTDLVLFEPFTNHNNDGTNMLMGDGSVQWITKAQAQPIIARAKAKQTSNSSE